MSLCQNAIAMSKLITTLKTKQHEEQEEKVKKIQMHIQREKSSKGSLKQKQTNKKKVYFGHVCISWLLNVPSAKCKDFGPKEQNY